MAKFNKYTKPFVIVELFEPKTTLYYDDSNYQLLKFGEFISYSFDINVSTALGSNAGQIQLPKKVSMTRPIKRGDIVQCTLVNFPADTYITGTTSLTRNRFISAYSVSSFDGINIVLVDCIQYNYSFTTVGYVGRVKNSLLDVLSILGSTDCRAYAMKQFTFGNQVVPFNLRNGTEHLDVLFQSEFTSTNVNPFDVISQAVENVLVNGGKDALRMGSIVESEPDGTYYLEQYINYKTTNFNTFVEDVRIKPSISLSVEITESNFAGVFWIQYKNNADNYLKAGVLVRTRSGIKRPIDITPPEREQSPITSIPSYLVSFADLLDAGVVSDGDVLSKAECEALLADPRLSDVVSVLGADFENMSFTISDTDMYEETNYLNGDELLRVYYQGVSKFAVNGVRMVVTNINFSPSGRRYSLKSTTTIPESQGGKQ